MDHAATEDQALSREEEGEELDTAANSLSPFPDSIAAGEKRNYQDTVKAPEPRKPTRNVAVNRLEILTSPNFSCSLP